MFRKVLYLFIIVFFNQYIHLINCECPPNFVTKPCSCKSVIPSHTYLLFNDKNLETITTQKKSINQPNAAVGIRVLIKQNNMLHNDNTILHQEVQQLVLQLNQQQIDSDRQPRETLSNLLESNRMLTVELDRVKKEIFHSTGENNRATQEIRV
ncbi:unnamed protein product [Rotaria sp. Silwood2]|nr:unnamed protein product [Rotaria sp. Silwood2]